MRFEGFRPMPSMLVTCPESGHLESLEYEDHPLGMLIESCTRFSPACAITCDRICAARIDRRRRSAATATSSEQDDEEEATVIEIRR